MSRHIFSKETEQELISFLSESGFEMLSQRRGHRLIVAFGNISVYDVRRLKPVRNFKSLAAALRCMRRLDDE